MAKINALKITATKISVQALLSISELEGNYHFYL